MNIPNVLGTPPISEERNEMLTIRLNTQERNEVNSLAQQLGVKPSTMARFFLLRIAALYREQVGKGGDQDDHRK